MSCSLYLCCLEASFIVILLTLDMAADNYKHQARKSIQSAFYLQKRQSTSQVLLLFMPAQFRLWKRSSQIQYQMQKQTNKVIDSVSASELLKALSTLKSMNCHQTDFDISFSKENYIRPDDFPDHHNIINYQNFKNCQRTPKATKSIYYQQKNKVSPSPLKEVRTNQPVRPPKTISRSHSPLDKKSERSYSRISHLSKQNPKQPLKKQAEKRDVPCPSMESKRIISQKQKSGYNYVPIQHRAEELLREKQQKIARLQKQKQFSKILQQKQCTFKPQIKAYAKKPKANDRSLFQHRVSEEERQRFEECFIDKEFICTPTQPFNQAQHSEFQQSLYVNIKADAEVSESKVCARKYKNDKFNFLLDLIQ